jgi:hypothetical protein
VGATSALVLIWVYLLWALDSLQHSHAPSACNLFDFVTPQLPENGAKTAEKTEAFQLDGAQGAALKE